MARTLTKKQRGFVKDYIETGNGGVAAARNYDVSTDESARAIASQNLIKPVILEAFAVAGFTVDGAKQVVERIMYNPLTDAGARLKATDQVFKFHGAYAPEKSISMNVNVEVAPSDRIRKLAIELNKLQGGHPYEENEYGIHG